MRKSFKSTSATPAFLLASSTAAALALALGGANCAEAVIVCGTTIGPDETVVLDEDQNCNSNPAILVMGPATLDLNGFTVTCASDTQVGISIIGEKAKVQTGVVTGCDDGVSLSPVGSKHQVVDIVSRENAGIGIANGAPNSKLTRNTAAGNGQSGFFNFAASSQFKENTATDNASNGFTNSVDGEKAKFIKNMSAGNGDGDPNDFGFGNSGASSTYTGNSAIDNDGAGFQNVAAGVKFTKNTSAGNGNDGFLMGGSSCTLTSNRSFANAIDGIDSLMAATDSKYKKNIALANGVNDLVDRNVDCDNNLWQSNTAGVVDPSSCIE